MISFPPPPCFKNKMGGIPHPPLLHMASFLVFSLIKVSGRAVWSDYYCLVSLGEFGLEVKQAFVELIADVTLNDTASVWLGSWGQAEPCDCRIFKGPERSSPFPRRSMFLLQVDKNNDVSFFVTGHYINHLCEMAHLPGSLLVFLAFLSLEYRSHYQHCHLIAINRQPNHLDVIICDYVYRLL